MGSMIFPADLHGWLRDFHEFPMWKNRSQRGAAAPLTFCAAASMGSVTHRIITPRKWFTTRVVPCDPLKMVG